MFPELFRIPGLDFTVNTYGVLLAISFISGLWLAAKLAERDGYDSLKIYDCGLFMLLAVLVGSKVLMIVTEWQSFVADPGQLFKLNFWRSAGVYYGGFIGAVTASFFLARYYKIPWWSLADACAPGVGVGQFFGRLGCFSAGCCWGKPTTGWIGVQFTQRAHELTGVPIDVHLHPTQLYESAAMFVITLTLLYIHSKKRFRGQVILSYVVLYSMARFIIEIFRDDPRGALFGLSTSQLISVIIGPIALVLMIYRWMQAKNPPVNPQQMAEQTQ